jgi:hypothetical protein
MSQLLANEFRSQYDKAFGTIREIAVTFPEDRWLEPHGDTYYIPCRIAYHLAVVVDSYVNGGFKDKDFASKLPFGNWMEATAETLPDKNGYLTYLDGVLDRAEKSLAALSDEVLASPIDPERSRLGATKLGMHLFLMRELSAHTGELNKMLIENGKEDIFIFK